jgi:hypothetical protein
MWILKSINSPISFLCFETCLERIYLSNFDRNQHCGINI